MRVEGMWMPKTPLYHVLQKTTKVSRRPYSLRGGVGAHLSTVEASGFERRNYSFGSSKSCLNKQRGIQPCWRNRMPPASLVSEELS